MERLLILSPLFVPLLAVVIIRRLVPHSVWLQLGAASFGGAICGAFLLSAASAMTSAVSPATAMLRGAAFGAGAGLVVGVLYLLAEAAWRNFKQKL